jgi:sialate O-acetylesterase
MNGLKRLQHPSHRLFGMMVFGLFIGLEALAAPRLPGFFTANMVLQRDRDVPVWGWADPGENIVVSFAGQTATATASESGTWQAKLAPMPASGEARSLSVSSATDPSAPPVELANVVVGDVWICSGQSNMEFAMGSVMQAKEELAAANYPLIRHMKVERITSDLPAADLRSNWIVCSPETAAGFTAVGYFFASKLHQELNVPIGLIGCNWGGTKIEPWTPPEGFRSIPELAAISAKVDATLPATPEGKAAYQKALGEMRAWLPVAEAAVAKDATPPALPLLPSVGSSHQDPTRIYNAMVHPLIPFAIRGAIWYQGESNGDEGISYHHKKMALLNGWRALWKQGDFPFYYVQLANYGQPNDNPAGSDGYSRVREAQLKSLDIPKTGMAVIIDIGEAGDIHPRNKQDVGRRLALWALAKEYGQTNLVHSGPLFKGFTVEGNAVRISFNHIGSGLMVGKKTGLEPVQEMTDGKLARFAIAGADKHWQWAEARIEGNTVVVSCAAVPEPVAVRYAFSHNPQGCNLYNREGLPASPFRTDDW